MVGNIKTPLKFDGLNFPIWKVRMNIFLQSLGSLVAKSSTKPFSKPEGEDDTWSKLTSKEFVLAQRPSTLVLMMINSCSYVY